MAKPRMTSFARFFIFLLIATPLAFFAASYINGEDGVQTLKGLVGKNDTTEEVRQKETPKTDTKVDKLADELSTCQKRNDDLYDENIQLKKELEALKTEN